MYTMLATATNDLLSISLTPQMLSVIPLLAVAIQTLKAVGLPAKLTAWLPHITVAAALAIAVVMKMGDDIPSRLFAGLIMGLASAGGYDTAKVAAKAAKAAASATTTASPGGEDK